VRLQSRGPQSLSNGLYIGPFLTMHFLRMGKALGKRTSSMFSRLIHCMPTVSHPWLTIAHPDRRYDTQVGYCQGLPFVVAILLLNVSLRTCRQDEWLIRIFIKMPDEEAFSLLVKLMYVYDLRGHFLPEMPKLQLRLVCCDCFQAGTAY
jgi:Rab-GTPase-TBC domain